MKYIKIGDIAVVILSIFAIVTYIRFSSENKTDIIIIETPTSKYRYLSTDNRAVIVEGILGEISIGINNGSVRFLDAPCRDKICIKAGDLKHTPLICLPSGVSVYYENLKTEDGEDIDSFVQ